MAEEMKPQIKKTWKPTVAGILDIIGGAYIGFILIRWLSFIFLINISDFDPEGPLFLLVIFGFTCFIAIATYLSAMVFLAIAGGVSAIRRKIWGLALAGSIAVFLSPLLLHIHWQLMEYSQSLHPSSWIAVTLLGIAAIVLVAISKKEFG